MDLAVIFFEHHCLDDPLHLGSPADVKLAPHAFEELGAGAGDVARGQARAELLPRRAAAKTASEETAVDHDQRRDAVRVQGCGVERDVGAPGVADDGGGIQTEVVQQADGVGS